MSVSQLSNLAAIGSFDGAAVEQLTPSRGFGAIVRTNGVPAGSWDITVDVAVAGALTASECQILVSCEGKGLARNSAQYSIVDEATLRIQNFEERSAALDDCVFSVAIHRIN